MNKSLNTFLLVVLNNFKLILFSVSFPCHEVKLPNLNFIGSYAINRLSALKTILYKTDLVYLILFIFSMNKIVSSKTSQVILKVKLFAKLECLFLFVLTSTLMLVYGILEQKFRNFGANLLL